MRSFRILVINMGSTSTKVALFEAAQPVFQDDLGFSWSMPLAEQLPLRREQLLQLLKVKRVKTHQLDLIVSRGGLTGPLAAGIYRINRKMCDDLMSGKYGVHPSSLGPVIALELADQAGIMAVTLDTPVTDEFHELARISGIHGIERQSVFHALSQKAAARKAAASMGKKYEDASFVIAHLGGGITVGAHLRGRVIDCTHALSEGPFTPERAGSLPTLPLVEMVCAGSDKSSLYRQLIGEGGLASYLNTKDARVVENRIALGEAGVALIFKAMAYQIAKEIGAMATVLSGEVDAVVLTGGLSRSSLLTEWVKERVSFIAHVLILPENEMLALAQGGCRVLAGIEQVTDY